MKDNEPGPRRSTHRSNNELAHDKSETSALIRVEGLTRRFGETTAVQTLTFDVARGELFGLVGPDGAGKTTTLRMLAGVLPPTEGDAWISGTSVAHRPEDVKPHIAYMAQRFGLYEDLTVRENLEFYADLYRVPKRERAVRLERLYAFSRLGEFEDRLAGALSGGMKQKLSLSCSLIHQPDLLLLDEPTFGVDPISRRDLWLILHEMVASGVTVIVSTSYLDEAERCDRVALLDSGVMLALDRPTVLQETLPGRLYEMAFDHPRRARDQLRASALVRTATLFGPVLHVQLEKDASIEAVTEYLATHDLEPAHVSSITASLEDIFLDRVGRRARTSTEAA